MTTDSSHSKCVTWDQVQFIAVLLGSVLVFALIVGFVIDRIGLKREIQALQEDRIALCALLPEAYTFTRNLRCPK
jgi:hypothetical protein